MNNQTTERLKANFDELDYGDFFVYDNYRYMKILNATANAVCISNGETYTFDNDAIIETLSVRITEYSLLQ